MEIKITELSLKNFQGIRKETFHFSNNSDVYGDNATGKTTIANAFTWLMFGKNLNNELLGERVKTLDKNNNPIPKLEHEVQGEILVDGVLIRLKRVLKEKWIKKRGEAEAVFQGNTENYFVDDVPVTKKEYSQKIHDLISEDQFKLITNPLYLNGVMDWRARRKILFDVAKDGMFTLAGAAGMDEELLSILPEVTQKSPEGFKKQLAAKRKKLNELLKEIPSRIDEVSRNMPEMPKNIGVIKGVIETLENELKAVDNDLTAINRVSDERIETLKQLNNRIFELRRKQGSIEVETARAVQLQNQNANSKIDGLKANLEELNLKLKPFKDGSKIFHLQNSISENSEIRTLLKVKWEGINVPFDTSEVQTVCPTCKQELPVGDITVSLQTMRGNHNSFVANQWKAIKAESLKLKELISQSEADITKLIEEARELELEIVKAKADLEIEENKPQQQPKKAEKLLKENIVYKELIAEIETTKNEANELTEASLTPKDEDKPSRQQEILEMLKEYNSELAKVTTIREKNERITKLNEESKEYALQIAAIEKMEFALERLNKAYISGIEKHINSMFEGVEFRMFKHLINGGEEEDCTLLLNGVSWADINSAGKIQAGLSCIETICNHYGYSAPVFVDNAESIVKLPKINSQVIRLIVSQEHSELKIFNN